MRHPLHVSGPTGQCTCGYMAARANIVALSSGTKSDITGRITQLDRQWPLERAVEITASLITLVSIALSVAGGRLWLILAAVGALLIAQQALQGWCLLSPLFRLLGLRSEADLLMERYALKLLRGDFDSISEALQDQSADADSVLDAVRN